MVQKKGGTVLSAASLSINKVLDGMDSFLYIRFSEFPDGRNMSSEPNEKTKYIGVVSTKENRPPSDPARYAWTAFKGADGEKTFLWVRYSEQDGGKPKMESNPSIKTQYMGVYSGPETTAPTDATKYRWVKTKGEQGESSYLHVRYSDYADGTGFYEKPRRTTMFIGVAVTVSEKAPVNKEAYDWAEFGVNIEFGGRNYILESLAPVIVKKQDSRKWVSAYPSSRFSKDWPGYTGFAVTTIHGYTSGAAYPENVKMRLVGLKGTARVYEEEFSIPQSELRKKEFEYSHVFIIPEAASTANSYLLEVYSWTEDMELEIDRIKLERGNRPTDWSGAPEDVNSEMMEIKKESASLGVLIQKLESGKASTAELQALATELSGYVKSNTSYGGVKITDQGVLLDSTNMEVVLDQRNGFLIKTKSPGQTVLQVDKDGKFIINASNLNTDVGKAQAEAEKAKQAAEEANKTKVKSVEMQYYLSSSTTILSGGKWESVAPEWTPNKFMWNRTKTVYGDGSIVYTPSEKGTCIAGAKGQDGVAGKDGVGIIETTIDYAISNSGSQRPENGWSPSVPQLTKGRYLWTRTVWKYSDSSKETGYSVTYISKDGNSGKDGLPGKDGVGIKTTTITYAKSANGVNAPGSGWTSSVPSVPDGQYLWTKTVWMYTDGTSETGYSVAKMGEKGGQGVQGPPGKDGQATYTWIKYADSPTSGMSDSPTNKKYIGLAYNKTTKTESTNYSDYQWSLVKGSDGIPGKDGKDGKPTYTWIVYADDIKGNGISKSADGKGYMGIAYNKDVPTPTLTASLYEWVELVGALDFGGVNMFRESSNFKESSDFWKSNGGGYKIKKDGHPVYGNTVSTTAGSGITGVWYKLENGVQYTYSALVKANESFSGTSTIPIHYHAGKSNVHQSKLKVLDYRTSYDKRDIGKFKLLYITFTLTEDADSFKPFIYFGPSKQVEFEIAYLKLERGNRPSDWSMAPEDARVYSAWSNSLDGREDFVTEYPNANLLVGTTAETKEVTVGGWGDYRDYGIENSESLMEDKALNPGDKFTLSLFIDASKSKYPVAAFLRAPTKTNPYRDLRTNWIDAGKKGYAEFSGEVPDDAISLSLRVVRFNQSDTPPQEVSYSKVKIERGLIRTPYVGSQSEFGDAAKTMRFKGLSATPSKRPEDYVWQESPEYSLALMEQGLGNKVDSSEYENDREEIQTSLGDKASKDELKEIEDLANQIQNEYEEFIKDGGRYEADLESLEKRISAMVLNLGDKIAEFNFINKYIKLGEEGLLLGDSTSLMNILISDKRISFFDGGKEVAYMEGQEFRINRGTILESLQVGSHKMEQVDANSTIFTFIS